MSLGKPIVLDLLLEVLERRTKYLCVNKNKDKEAQAFLIAPVPIVAENGVEIECGKACRYPSEAILDHVRSLCRILDVRGSGQYLQF